MLGVRGKGWDSSNDKKTAIPKSKGRVVNLMPRDIEEKVAVSQMYPNGIRLIPAATQEDFKQLLLHVPETAETIGIGELSAAQEVVVRDCLFRNCQWYREQNPLPVTATPTGEPQDKKVFNKIESAAPSNTTAPTNKP